MKKEININKKFILTLLLINVFIIGISYSYALFQVNVIKNSIVEFKVTTINVNLTSSNLIDNKTLTLSANETREVTLTLENTSSIDAKAKLYYISNTGDITFESETTFINDDNIIVGELLKDETKEITLTITNNTSSEVTLELGVVSGLPNYDLILSEEKQEIEINVETAADVIISKLGSGGLVAVNTSGTLYSGSGTIREYRYSGASADNYVIFNDDGDNVTEVNELWRIVGVFQNNGGEWNLKLMRDNVLTNDELPNSYLYANNSLSYYLYNRKYDSDNNISVYWSKDNDNYKSTNDWSKSGLQYFLNTNTDTNGVSGYYSTFTTNAKKLIDTNYTYYLGFSSDSSSTAITAYTSERSEDSVWQTHEKATWNGGIVLLYTSDYAYSTSSTYWSTKFSSYTYSSSSTSWIYESANHEGAEWLFTPHSSFTSNLSAMLLSVGKFNDAAVDENTYHARPCLNLVSSAKIEEGGLGTYDSPYVIKE